MGAIKWSGRPALLGVFLLCIIWMLTSSSDAFSLQIPNRQQPASGTASTSSATNEQNSIRSFDDDDARNINYNGVKQPLTSKHRIAQSEDQQHHHTAVLLNTNARAVTPQVVAMAESIFGRDHVFATSTAEQALRAVEHILDAGDYQLLVPVGGDGTLASLITTMTREMQQTRNCTMDEALQQLPLIGYIPMGTGNGVGSVVACRAKDRRFFPRRRQRQTQATFQALHDIGQQLTTRNSQINDISNCDIVELPMIQVTANDNNSKIDDLCFFAGVGFDSLMLNDFKEIKAWSQRTGFLRNLLTSVAGYCVALVVRTLPQAVRGKHCVHIHVTSRDDECVWIDHRRGDVMRRCESPELFDGVTGILAAGSSPFYGGGLRLFPFARMTLDKMHLRLGRIHPLVGFINIPRIFAGSYRDTSENMGVLDFVGNDFDVQVMTSNNGDDGYPFQHSGESVGSVQRFRLRTTTTPVRFVSLLRKRATS